MDDKVVAPPAKNTAKEDAAAIEKMVSSSQKKGFLNYDLAAYAAVWASDAHLIGARGPDKGEHDFQIAFAKVLASKKLRFVGTSIFKSMTFENVNITVHDDEALLQWQVEIAGDQFAELMGETYKLRKSKDGWRIYENRYWPIRLGGGDVVTTVDADYWRRKDADATAARGNNDAMAEIRALLDGYRYAEAYKRVRELTDSAESKFWANRAVVASVVGEADDAKTAVCKARANGREKQLPSWSKSVACPE